MYAQLGVNQSQVVDAHFAGADRVSAVGDVMQGKAQLIVVGARHWLSGSNMPFRCVLTGA